MITQNNYNSEGNLLEVKQIDLELSPPRKDENPEVPDSGIWGQLAESIREGVNEV